MGHGPTIKLSKFFYKMTAVMKTLSTKRHVPARLWSLQSVRLQMSLLLMLAFLMLSLMRGNLGMALVCMVERSDNTTDALTDYYNTELQVRWSGAQISVIHLCFYVGIFVCTFVAQKYAQQFGPKAVITMGLVVNVLCTWAVPLATVWVPHFATVAALRFAMGLSQGFFIPCASLLIAKWFPESEKCTAMAIFTTGNQFGIAIAMFSTAELCKLPMLAGWPTSFLAYGVLGMLFLLLWLPFASDKPRESKRICAEEVAHIDGISGIRRNRSATIVMRTPYMKLLLSPAILAICLCSFCQSFVFVAMISYLPEFFRAALHLDLTSNGIWSALPFIVQFVAKAALAVVADAIRDRGVSNQIVTKAFNLIASFGCAACMFAVSVTADPKLMLVFLCAAFGFISGYVPGYNTSMVCVAPAYTAAVSAYGQAFAQVASIIAPIAIGRLTADEPSGRAWGTVFQLLVVVLVLSGCFFQLFGSTEVQPWAATGSRTSSRVQRISEANEQFKREDVQWDLAECREPIENEEADADEDSPPRMHHRMSVLDI